MAVASEGFVTEVILTASIYVRKIPLPWRVRAFTLPDEQGDFNVYINEKLSAEQQNMSLRHELQHIINEDFYKEKSAIELEKDLKIGFQ